MIISNRIIAVSVPFSLYIRNTIGKEKATTNIVVTNSLTPYPLKNSSLVRMFAGIYRLLFSSNKHQPPSRHKNSTYCNNKCVNKFFYKL